MGVRAQRELLAEVGQRVRTARTRAGLSQEAAAGRAEIDWRRWQRLEDGTVNATLRTLARVAEAVGLTFWELLEVSPTPPSAAPKRAKRQP